MHSLRRLRLWLLLHRRRHWLLVLLRLRSRYWRGLVRLVRCVRRSLSHVRRGMHWLRLMLNVRVSMRCLRVAFIAK